MLKWLYKQLSKKDMSYYLDKEKIKAKINELNYESDALAKLLAPKPKNPLPLLQLKKDFTDTLIDIWDEVPGLYWYDETVRQKIEDPVTLMPSGILLKLFANKKTGEFRSFPAKMFE